jgi:hypothetical protein
VDRPREHTETAAGHPTAVSRTIDRSAEHRAELLDELRLVVDAPGVQEHVVVAAYPSRRMRRAIAYRRWYAAVARASNAS